MRIEYRYIAENADGAPINTTLVMQSPTGRWNVFENEADNGAYAQFTYFDRAEECAKRIAARYESPINPMPPRQ